MQIFSMVIRWIVRGIVVIGIVSTLYIALNSGDDKPTDDIEFRDIRVKPSDEDNAYLGLIAMTQALKQWPEKNEYPGKLTPERVHELLTANADALGLFHTIAMRPVWFENPKTDVTKISVPFTPFVWIMRLQRLKIEELIAKGDIHAATEDIKDTIRFLSTIMSGADELTVFSVTLNMCDSTSLLAMKAASSEKATEEDMLQLLESVRNVPPILIPSFKQVSCRTYSKIFSPGVDIVLNKSRRGSFRRKNFQRYAFKPNRTKALYIKEMQEAITISENDFSREEWKAFETRQEQAMPITRNLLVPNIMGRAMAQALTPDYGNIVEKITLLKTRMAFAEIVIAAERMRLRTGKNPDGLAALVPDYLPAVPLDPFNRGMALKYDSAKRMVYTVGPEGTFNPATTEISRIRDYVRYSVTLGGLAQTENNSER
ncbi:MAG: hypothetical protein IJU44_12105 [Kiritimatiellae bacterium]|nr:hypothetical protein [Kiritimatiellia bacterium]